MSGSSDDTHLFAEIAADWAGLAAWIAAAMPIAVTGDQFAERYGAFTDTDEVGHFIRTVAKVQSLADDTGGPAALKHDLAADPETLQRAEPPSSLYGQLVWLAGRSYNAAQAAASTLDGIAGGVAIGDPADARAGAVKALLAGPDGLVQSFGDVRLPAEALAAAFDTFAGKVQPLCLALLSTKLMNQAQIAIGQLDSEDRHLQEVAQKQQSTSLFSRSETQPTDPSAQIAANAAERARKQALVDDGAALLDATSRIPAVVAEINADVAAIALHFQRAANQLLQFAAISDSQQLSDPAWISQALNLPVMIADWRALAQAAQGFAQNALVTRHGAPA